VALFNSNTGRNLANMRAMPSSTRTEAQQRADEIRTFRAEMARLEQDGVLQLPQADRETITRHHDELLARLAREFDIDRDMQAKQLSLGMRITSFVGAVALAASVFFLFYQFWGRFSTPVQVAILLAAALGSFALTCWIHTRDSSGYFSKLAALVAFACFVLNIAMQGQIFNISPSDKALLPWAAFAFLLAYSFDLRLLLATGILCVIAYLSARTGAWGGMYWLHFGERPENFFPAAFLIFAMPQLVDHRRFTGFAEIYRVFGLVALLLPMLVLAHWGAASYLALEPSLVAGIYQALGLALCAAIVAYGVRRHWPEVVNTGVAFFGIFLFSKFFDWWWKWMPKYLFFLLIGMSAVVLLLVFRRLRGRA
jgi:uncharacterized membrane protein